MMTDKKIPGKLKNIQKNYMKHIFARVDKVSDVLKYETKLHYRRTPKGGKIKWTKVENGHKWGDNGLTAWFKGKVRMPKSLAGQKIFVRAITGGAETMFLVNDEPRGVFDYLHHTVMLTKRAVAGESFNLSFEAYAGHNRPTNHPHNYGVVIEKKAQKFEGIQLMVQRDDIKDFVFDLYTLNQMAETLDENSLQHGQVLKCLEQVYKTVDAMPCESKEKTWRPLLKKARQLMRPVLEATNGTIAPMVGLFGHSHLDTAWLWTISETERKCARTFSSALNLMEQYPEFRFLQSTPYHGEIIRSEYPSVFKDIKKRVRQGRWEPNGAMWVEPDCNMPSGEALVRQLLFGQNWTREMFGYTADTLWLPDVFGYSAALPQILQGCMVKYFCTVKMDWNDMTEFPYDTFRWKGIDGSSVVTHFNSTHVSPDLKTLTQRWNRVKHKDIVDRHLLAYGIGDGGGGPEYEMIEMSRRIKDLQGCPRSKHMSLTEFMDGIVENCPNLPAWEGELYLQLHRGTLTSIARIKRGNRKAEIALHDAEMLASLARIYQKGKAYPADKLDEIWKIVLVNQFHDILPGSSIEEANDRAIAELDDCTERAESLCQKALRDLAGKGNGRLVIANTTSWDRCSQIVVDRPAGGIEALGQGITSQKIEDVNGRKKLAISGAVVPAIGTAVLELGKTTDKKPSAFKMGNNTVESPFARVRFASDGRIVSFVDKPSGRQLVKNKSAMNTFWIGQDVPEKWDNWDIDYDQKLKMAVDQRMISRNVVSDGPLQLRIRSKYKIGNKSEMVQDMVFHAENARVDFETVIDWNEKHKLLKAGFDIDILSSYARHEMQYGYVDRPMHENELQDRAQFEVCNHKWTDISEADFGVAILNDCKYGISADSSDLRLSLLKAGRHPDGRGDKGRHEFTYSILPHDGAFSVKSVVRPAYELNMPVKSCLAAANTKALDSFVSVDKDNVIVETVKVSEDKKGIVLRLYEAAKSRTKARLKFSTTLKRVYETNMLEENRVEIASKKDALSLSFRPFEIKTIYCEIKK